MLNYATLLQQDYVNLLVDLIAHAEGRVRRPTRLGDRKTTIGYGYTFGRNNNLALWTAAGISLTAPEQAALAQIDATQGIAQKEALAFKIFKRSINQEEAEALLRQTYASYELNADNLAMPSSRERAALVSLTYSRGGSDLSGRMKGFFDAVRAGDRAEAWFQMRYMSWGTARPIFEAGLRARRLVESQVFGLYDSLTVSAAEARNVYTMLNRHRGEIMQLESKWGMTPDGIPGTRNLYAFVNAEPRWDGYSVQTLTESLEQARDSFISWVNTQLPLLVAPLSPADWNPAAIYYNPASTTLSARLDDGKGATGGGPRLDKNLIVGGIANDTIEGGKGDDVLMGGLGKDIYIYNDGDGNDTIIDPDGGVLRYKGVDHAFGGGTMKKGSNPSVNEWFDPSGVVKLTHNSPWTLILPGGGTISFGEDFDPEEWGITLVEDQPPPITSLTFSGDREIADGDPGEPGVQVEIDELGNRETTLNVEPMRDLLHGGTGNDRIIGGQFGDILKGRDGNDIIFAEGEVDIEAAIQNGASGAGSGPLSMSGANNNDFLMGEGGEDILVGTANSDLLAGGGGSDLLIGGQGDDYLDGDAGISVTTNDYTFNWNAFWKLLNPVMDAQRRLIAR
jgi:GH24 family phage-related lysozyme (muramidase)